MAKVLLLVALCLLATVSAKPPRMGKGSRIVGGWNAQIGNFPHQVSLRVNNQHNCGGSILDQYTILTAAHCVDGHNVASDTAVVGTDTLNQGGVAYQVSSFVMHQGYDSKTIVNDIAIVKLASPIQFNINVQSIRLADRNPDDNALLTMSGWGLTSYPGSIPNQLQYFQTRNLNLQTCATEMAGVTTPITTGHVCIKSPVGQGICMGDSGGPLINANGQQVGLASWVIPCGVGRPDVFTSVAFYRGWILNYMN